MLLPGRVAHGGWSVTTFALGGGPVGDPGREARPIDAGRENNRSSPATSTQGPTSADARMETITNEPPKTPGHAGHPVLAPHRLVGCGAVRVGRIVQGGDQGTAACQRHPSGRLVRHRDPDLPVPAIPVDSDRHRVAGGDIPQPRAELLRGGDRLPVEGNDHIAGA